MGKKQLHGLDYTPLYKFLLSRVGKDYAETFEEAVLRLPKPRQGERRAEPIFDMVRDRSGDPEGLGWRQWRGGVDLPEIFLGGEYSLYSTLFVDDDGKLQKIAPGLRVEHISPYCPCHTHTFNGQRVTNPCCNPIFASESDPVAVDEGVWQGYIRRPS